MKTIIVPPSKIAFKILVTANKCLKGINPEIRVQLPRGGPKLEAQSCKQVLQEVEEDEGRRHSFAFCPSTLTPRSNSGLFKDKEGEVHGASKRLPADSQSMPPL